MATFFNEKEQALVEQFLQIANAIRLMREELSLQHLHLEAAQGKIKQYEAMTGVLRQKLPRLETMPDWEYMIKQRKNGVEDALSDITASHKR